MIVVSSFLSLYEYPIGWNLTAYRNSNHMYSKLALQHRRSHNAKRKSFKMGSWFFDLINVQQLVYFHFFTSKK